MSESLPVSMIRQWCFCPRVVYYRELLKLKPPDTLWMNQGQEHEEMVRQLLLQRCPARLGVPGGDFHFNVALNSEDLSLHGKVDAVLMGSSLAVPCEIKLSLHRIHRGYGLQICAYALLLERKYGFFIPYGWFFLGSKAKPKKIQFESKLRQQTLAALAEIRSMLDSELKPDSSASEAQCGQCEFLAYCNDRY